MGHATIAKSKGHHLWLISDDRNPDEQTESNTFNRSDIEFGLSSTHYGEPKNR